MKHSPFRATVSKPGFIPFLMVAFINAMVDLGHKIIIQNTIFKIYDDAHQVALTTIVNGLILLPFLLLFTPAGYLSDRFAKPHIMKWSALSAVVITLLITLSYYQGWFIFAFAMTFILAAQSALYSPAKYGFVRELCGEQGLSAGNGFIQAVTIVAILSGIFIFSVLFEAKLSGLDYENEADIIQLIAPIGWVLVGLSCIEWGLAAILPIQKAGAKHNFDWQRYRQGKLLSANLHQLKTNPIIWYAILGLSLFWGVSQTFLATFPAFAKVVLAENNTIVIQGLLACSGIGIMLGSLTAGIGNSSKIKTHLIPWGAIGMLVVLFIIPHLASSWLFAFAILLFGWFGGLFIIPLNALIQLHAPSEDMGKILAGNNWVQNGHMLLCLFFTFVATAFAISSQSILLYLPVVITLLAVILSQRLKRAQYC